ncbi:MgtC/SapB family protein [Novosphingobium aquiterrae]|uniref:MgtC/SapB family protein n=1 Tax=Novosphingobium aquiterrae TaxID=624388 RepID=A0ABV6PLK6_9SPHN
MNVGEPFSWGQLQGVGLALALGLLVGVQRGWVQRSEPAGSRFAGIRTYGLLGLAGGMAGALQAIAAPVAAMLLLAAAALVVLGYWRSTQLRPSISGTASIAGLITLAAGYMAGLGAFALASAVAGMTVLLLALRRQLHHILRHIDEQEIAAIARFALIALVILPLLPDTPMGPYGAWRPRQLWLVVVLVSGFSFAGYVGAKWLGATRGVLATAAAGSMVSSTAITAALAGKLRDDSGDRTVANAGIALASAVMFVRVMILTAALAPRALPTFAMLAVPGMLVSLTGFALIFRRGRSTATGDAAPVPRNPFDLKPAVLLMVLTMVLTVVARWVLARFGDAGLATVLAISGVVDVDSAIITLGNLPEATLAPKIAGLVLLPPVVLNTLFKAGAAVSLAGWRKVGPGAATLVAAAVGASVPLVFLL